MLRRLTRFALRLYLRARIRRLSGEIAHLEHVRAALGPALDRATREVHAARLDLVMLDIHRLPPHVAMRGAPWHGARAAEAREAALRG